MGTGESRRCFIGCELEVGSILVRHSWERNTTKGGHIDAIPVPAALVPWLEEALGASRTSLVFPGPNGGMFRRDVPLEAVLRRALGRAGIVRHWRHICRRKGCKHVEESQGQALRRCPRCQMKLWPKPVVRPIRFHDLRHTIATLLLRSGVLLVVVQKVSGTGTRSSPKPRTGTWRRTISGRKWSGSSSRGCRSPESPRLRAAACARVPPVSPTAARKTEGAGVTG
jgi:hypothetical protein